MKKSQILAAIALAFALGVVAPVATISNASAISFADATVEDSKDLASGAEVANAIAAAKSGNYDTAMALVNAVATFTEGRDASTPIYVNEFDGAQAKSVVDLATGVGIAVDSKLVTTDVTNSTATVAETQAIIDAVESNAKYSAAAGLIEAVNNEDENYNALVSAIKAYYTANEIAEDDQIDFTLDTGVAASFDSLVDAIKGTTEGGKYNIFTAAQGYSSLIGAVATAQNEITKYQDSLDLFTSIITDSILNEAGKEALVKASTPLQYAQIIKKSGAYQPNFDFSLDAYVALNSAIEAATPYANGETGNNWKKIEAIAIAYKTANNDNRLTTAVMKELAGATTDPTDPSNPDELVFQTLFSEDGLVSVAGNFPAGVTVRVISDGVALPSDSIFGEQKFVAYNITLWRNGKPYELNGQTVAVTMAVPTNINGANSDVIYVTPTGATENMNAKYADEAKTLSFTTNHFSIYAIVERAAGDNGDHTETPGNTGTVASAEGTASATGILAGIAAALTAAGAGVVAFRNARRNAKKNA